MYRTPLFNLLFAAVVAFPAHLSAQLESGPETVLGLGSAKTMEAVASDGNSVFSLRRHEPLFTPEQQSGIPHGPSYSLEYAGQISSSIYTLSLLNRDDDFHSSAGLFFDRFTALAHYGTSEGMVASRGQVSAVAPNFFHGSVSYDYQYSGGALEISLFGDLALLGGASFIEADGLENRSVYVSGISWRNFSSTLSSVSRGGETVGYGIAAGIDFASFDLAYQQLSSTSGADWREASIGFAGDHDRGIIRFSVAVGDNELYEAGDETRVAVLFSIPLGGQPLYGQTRRDGSGNLQSRLSEASASHQRMRKTGFRAVGTGLTLSSGSARLDKTPRFNSQNRAAHYALFRVNPVSVANNREYASTVYRNRDRTYSPSAHVAVGDFDSVTVAPYRQVPAGTTPAAVWHTHGAFKRGYLNEQFSMADIRASLRWNLDVYLGTPLGRMRLFDVDTGTIVTFINANGGQKVLPN